VKFRPEEFVGNKSQPKDQSKKKPSHRREIHSKTHGVGPEKGRQAMGAFKPEFPLENNSENGAPHKVNAEPQIKRKKSWMGDNFFQNL
jgi:hypothetical protein